MSWEQVATLIMSPVIAAVVSWWLNRDLKDEVRTQGRELDRLKTERVAGVERRIEEIASGGCSIGIQVRTKLETVIAQNNELLLEVRKLNRESENQGTRIEGAERSVSKLWDKFDDHRQHHPAAAPREG